MDFFINFEGYAFAQKAGVKEAMVSLILILTYSLDGPKTKQ